MNSLYKNFKNAKVDPVSTRNMADLKNVKSSKLYVDLNKKSNFDQNEVRKDFFMRQGSTEKDTDTENHYLYQSSNDPKTKPLYEDKCSFENIDNTIYKQSFYTMRSKSPIHNNLKNIQEKNAILEKSPEFNTKKLKRIPMVLKSKIESPEVTIERYGGLFNSHDKVQKMRFNKTGGLKDSMLHYNTRSSRGQDPENIDQIKEKIFESKRNMGKVYGMMKFQEANSFQEPMSIKNFHQIFEKPSNNKTELIKDNKKGMAESFRNKIMIKQSVTGTFNPKMVKNSQEVKYIDKNNLSSKNFSLSHSNEKIIYAEKDDPIIK